MISTFDCFLQDAKAKDIDNILILSGDHLYRMDYMDFVQVYPSLGSLCVASVFAILRI